VSVYTFLASDKPLKSVINTKVKYYSYEEAEHLGIKHALSGLPLDEKAHWLEIFNKANQDKGYTIMHVEKEEDMYELEVIPSEQPYIAFGAHGNISVAGYTRKKHIASYSHGTEQTKQFIEYITDQLNDVEDIEIWQIWAGAPLTTPVDISTCKIKDLSNIFLEGFFQDRWSFEQRQFTPGCLVIQKVEVEQREL